MRLYQVKEQQIILTIYRFSLALFFLATYLVGHSQYVTQISSAWDDSLVEWIIFTDDEELEGTIEMKWPANNDFSWWTYDLGELSGDIKRKWTNDPNLWEIRSSDGSVYTARTSWSNDFSEWEIIDGKNKYKLRSRYKNVIDQWQIGKGDSSLQIYMSREGDPRDWIVEDYLENGTLRLSIAASFIAILHSVGL